MNEKTPNAQTQAAMTQTREMARNRMLELVEPRDGVDSFPDFTKPARQRWEAIPTDIRQRLLSNCRRRLNFDPPCRSKFDPGRIVDEVAVGCG